MNATLATQSQPKADLTIYVNDKARAMPGSSTVLTLIRELGLTERRGVAVAVNGGVVSRDCWPTHNLATEDRVLVIQATQGG